MQALLCFDKHSAECRGLLTNKGSIRSESQAFPIAEYFCFSDHLQKSLINLMCDLSKTTNLCKGT